MSFIGELQAAGKVALDLQFQKGTLLDFSGNANTPTYTGSPSWRNGDRGTGLLTGESTSLVSCADHASLDLTQMTALVLMAPNHRFISGGAGLAQRLFCKRGDPNRSNYDVYLTNGVVGLYNEPVGLGNTVAVPVGVVPHAVAIRQPAGPSLPRVYVNGAFVGAGANAVTMTPNNDRLYVGNLDPVFGLQQPLVVPLHRLLIVNDGSLTDAQVAQLYNEAMSQAFALPMPRRNFCYHTPPITQRQMTTDGIIFCTDFVRRSDGKIRNFARTTNYPGTLVDTPVPYSNGDGMMFDGSNDGVSWGNVTQLSNATHVGIECIFRLRTAPSPSHATILHRGANASSRFGIEILNGDKGGGNYRLVVETANGADTYSYTDSARIGAWHHLLVKYEGTGATDADRVKVWLDGVAKALAVTNPPVPASLSGPGAVPLSTAYNAMSSAYFAPADIRLLRIRAVTILADDTTRGIYLNNFARDLIFNGAIRADGSAPETFAGITQRYTSVVAGSWYKDTVAGTVTVVADGGRRRVLLTTSGCSISVRQPAVYGSWYYEVRSSGIYFYIFNTNFPSGNGYAVAMTAAGVDLLRITSGVGASIGSYATADVVLGNTLRFFLTRAVSGAWVLWMKGGSLTAWTQIITATDNTYTSGAMMSFANTGQTYLGDVQIFRGAMTPVEAEELGLIQG